jgi:hypothetical protein
MSRFNIPDAIAREEGWYMLPPARCRRNNNPGNIDFADWTREFGATLEDVPPSEQARFACFPTPAQGFAALRALLGFPRYKGHTLADAIAAWAPPVENETTEYLRNVCGWTGLTPDTIIDAYLGDASDDPA